MGVLGPYAHEVCALPSASASSLVLMYSANDDALCLAMCKGSSNRVPSLEISFRQNTARPVSLHGQAAMLGKQGMAALSGNATAASAQHANLELTSALHTSLKGQEQC